jgi:hypothetical protein
VSVLLASCCPKKSGELRWLIDPPRNERKRLTLVAFLNESNTMIERTRLFPNIPFRKTKVPENSEWLASGTPLQRIPDFLQIVRALQRDRSK